MCWSKPAQIPSTTTTTTMMTTSAAMTTAPVNVSIDCPSAAKKCEVDSDFCLNGGQCCLPIGGGDRFCRCDMNFEGPRCQKRMLAIGASGSSIQLQSTGSGSGSIAAFGGILGVVVIILVVTLVFFRVKRRRRQRDPNQPETDRVLIEAGERPRRLQLRNDFEQPSWTFVEGEFPYTVGSGGRARGEEDGGGEGRGGGEVQGEMNTYQRNGIQETEKNNNKEKTIFDQTAEDSASYRT